MLPRRGLAIAVVVAMLAFAAPIFLSLQLAWNQSLRAEKEQGISYAREVLRRGDETATQFYGAIQRLNNDHLAPCSPQEIELMRQIDVGSSFIQMVGRISGNTLQCTSLGTTQPIEVGEPTLVTSHGVRERMNFQFGQGSRDTLVLLDRDGVAIVVDTSLLVDLSTQEDGVELAMTVPSSADHARLVQAGNHFRADWFKPVAPGAAVSLLDGGYVVSQVRSRQFDFAAISVVPGHYASSHVRQFAAAFVPTGLLCGIGLCWAVVYLCRVPYSLSGLIREAARKGDFYVEYQPVVEIATRRMVGAEALVRWRRGNKVISPANFIGLAEESGSIPVITASMIRAVARDLPWLLHADPEFYVSINLTATDLKNANTVDRLKELLAKSGATPRNVVIEATEHGLVDAKESQAVLETMKQLGFKLAIDDFGTGYSGLSYLEKLAPDVLKIDKLFVDTIGTDGPTSQVVLHVIEMAHSLKLGVIAEGVETEAQARFLEQRDVRLAQGWLFGRPMSAEELRKQLAASFANA